MSEQTFVYNSILLSGLEFNCMVRDIPNQWHWLLIGFSAIRNSIQKFSLLGSVSKKRNLDLFTDGIISPYIESFTKIPSAQKSSNVFNGPFTPSEKERESEKGQRISERDQTKKFKENVLFISV